MRRLTDAINRVSAWLRELAYRLDPGNDATR